MVVVVVVVVVVVEEQVLLATSWQVKVVQTELKTPHLTLQDSEHDTPLQALLQRLLLSTVTQQKALA